MIVKPAAGLDVRDPVTMQNIPPEGLEVDPHDLYWARRIADAEVVVAQPKPEAKPKG